jgi:F0F1-type ATP synthase membrane subunit b/b'
MTLLQLSSLNLSSIGVQYGILGILSVLLGYFAWNTYNHISKKSEEEYKRLVDKNQKLEDEVARLRNDMMSLIAEERDRMHQIISANTTALNDLRKTIIDVLIKK